MTFVLCTLGQVLAETCWGSVQDDVWNLSVTKRPGHRHENQNQPRPTGPNGCHNRALNGKATQQNTTIGVLSRLEIDGTGLDGFFVLFARAI